MASQSLFPLLQSLPFGPTTYGLTYFQSDQVLTADQLNEWVSFLMAQEQATRARLLGVGIATGLLPSVLPARNGIALTPGCGITTDGQLLRLEAPATYLAYQPVAAAAMPAYAPLQQLTLLKLLPDSTSAPGAKPLTDLALNGLGSLNDYAVVLYQDNALGPIETCQGSDCNDKGRTYDTDLQVLLVPQGSAAALLPAGLRAAATTYLSLPPLALRRPSLAGASHATRLQDLQKLLREDATAFGTALVAAAAALREVPDFSSYSSYTFSGEVLESSSLLLGRTITRRTTPAQRLRQQLINVATLTTDANCQYVYDWLKDIYEAYEAFRVAAGDPAWLGQAMPAPDDFARHLVLGECAPAPGLLAPQYRHAWRPAPAVAAVPNAAGRVLWLFKRIESLILQFKVPALASTGSTTTGISIRKITTDSDTTYQTPGTVATPTTVESLSKLVPTTEVQSLSKTFQTTTTTASSDVVKDSALLMSDLATTAVFTSDSLVITTGMQLTPDRARRAGFDQRSLPFYYDPAVRASWSYAKTAAGQAAYILTYKPNTTSTAPQVVSPLSYQLEDYDFFRIEGLLDAPASVVLSQLLKLRNDQNLPFDVAAVSADPLTDGQVPLVSADNPTFTSQKTQFTSLLTLLRADEVAANLRPLGAVDLTLTIAAFTQLASAYTAANSPLPANVQSRLDALKSLNKAYNDFRDQLTFTRFLAANPGLEHGAGVPRGGTFVLVYRTLSASATVPLVVADYYLPYRQGGGGPVTQFVLPEPDPLIKPSALVVSTQDTEVLIDVTPSGGTFTVKKGDGSTDNSLIEKRNGVFYFLPQRLVPDSGLATSFAKNGTDAAVAGKSDIGGSVQDGIVAETPHFSNQTCVLTYTLPNGKSDTKEIFVMGTVYLSPLTPVVGADGTVTFQYTAHNAALLVIDFGDGQSESYDLPLKPKTDPEATFINPYSFTHKYETTTISQVKLIAYNGAHASLPATCRPNLQALKPSLLGEKIIAQKTDYSLQGSPQGGTYFLDNVALPNAPKYQALTAGQHVAKYHANDQDALLDIFAAPTSFRFMGYKLEQADPDWIISGYVNLPTPAAPFAPTDVQYDWSLKTPSGIRPLSPTGGEHGEAGEYSFSLIERGTTQYTFKIRVTRKESFDCMLLLDSYDNSADSVQYVAEAQCVLQPDDVRPTER